MRDGPRNYAEFRRNPEKYLEDRPLPPFERIASFPRPGQNLCRMAAKLANKSAIYEAALASKGQDKDRASNLALEVFPEALHYLAWSMLYMENSPLLYWSHPARPPVVLATLSGTRLGLDIYGPQPLLTVPGVSRPEVMLVAKAPGHEDHENGCCFSGDACSSLFRALTETHVADDEVAGWYATNLIKWRSPTPGTDKFPAELVKEGRFLLACELWALRPDHVLALGLEAVKELAGPTENVGLMVGRVVEREFTYTIHDDDGLAMEDRHKTIVMASQSPGAVARKPEQYVELRDSVARFTSVVAGGSADFTETDVEHWAVWTEDQLAAHVDRAIAEHDPLDGDQPIALDAEWEGRYPTEPGSWLRTVQFSHRAKYACVIELRNDKGEPIFEGGPEAVTRQLDRLLTPTDGRGVRVGGHAIRADLPWLRAKLGLNLTRQFAAAPSAEATRRQGGFDSLYLVHAVHEALSKGGYKLEALAARLCSVPRYDLALQDWKRKHKESDEELNGYGFCPRDVLVGKKHGETDPVLGDRVLGSYAGYDADVTIRLFDLTNGRRGEPGLLDEDAFGLDSRASWWISQRAMPGFLEMEMHGLVVDRERVDALTHVLEFAADRLKKNLRRRLRWRGFNPNSDVHRREFLFGVGLNGFIDKVTGKTKRARPDYVSAVPNVRPRTPHLEPWQPPTLGLVPIKPSGVKGKSWAQIEEAGKTQQYKPATDRVTLEVLSGANPLVGQLRDTRTLQTSLQTVLRRPDRGEDGAPTLDRDGNWTYKAGLMGWLHADGRIRTNFFPVETARCSSSRPPLQNISKSKEAQFEAILGRYVRDRDTGEIKPKGNYLDLFGRPLYRFPVRSILRSTPGRVLIEADYTGAELAIMAWQSGDPQMIEDVARNLLGEDHPDYLDLHSQTAVTAFHLDCAPTKKGLEDIGKVYLRTGAKPINFGVPYGISPSAIALKCLAEGTKISIEEANAMRDGYFTRWPGTRDYLDEAAQRVISPGWIAGPHGRFRRFYSEGVDEKTLAELQRQAWNYTIQNGVADTISQAMGELVTYRQADGGRPRFDLVLQIHDALLVECDPADVEYTVAALKECMCQRVPIYPRRLDGTPTGAGPYRFGVDVDLYEHWGVKLSDARARELGAPDKAAIKKMIANN